MTDYQVTKIPGPYQFNDDDELVLPEGVTLPEGHRIEMLKGKGDKGKPLTCYIIPDFTTQVVIQVEHEDNSSQIGAMIAEFIDRNQKLRLNEYDDGEIAARDYVLDVGKLAMRFFVDNGSLGVKQAMIEEWITAVLQPYMVARIAKNAGFTPAQRESLVSALTQKFLIASTRDNEVKDKQGNIMLVSKDELSNLLKRLEQYNTDENNKLPDGDELSALMGRIRKHMSAVKKELETTNADF